MLMPYSSEDGGNRKSGRLPKKFDSTDWFLVEVLPLLVMDVAL